MRVTLHPTSDNYPLIRLTLPHFSKKTRTLPLENLTSGFRWMGTAQVGRLAPTALTLVIVLV